MPCPLPDAAGVVRHHRLAFMASECLAEFIKVPHNAIDAEHPRRVRIGFRRYALNLIGAVLAPYLRVGDKEPLRSCIAVDLRFRTLLLLGQRTYQRLIGDAKAAIIRRVFTQRKLAVQMRSCNRLKAAVFFHFAVRPRIELFSVRRRPPVLYIALRVIPAAFIIKAMRHFMADHHANGSRVHGRVLGVIKEWRLQNAGRKVDVVHGRIVVGIDRWRRHTPFLFIHRLAQMIDLPVPLESSRPPQIADKIIALDFQLRVIAPLFRVANLLPECLQLHLCLFFCLLAHPRQ
jgi:hypothetical protein